MAAVTQPHVFVGGRPLSTFAPGWGDLKITHRWPFGCWEMAFTIALRGVRRFPQLAAGSLVEARYGPRRIWSGFMSEPDYSTGEMVALGLSRQGEEVLALSPGGTISTTPDEAIDQAIAAGYVNWVRRSSLGSTPLADASTSSTPIYLNDLLNAATKAAGKGWGVSAAGEVYATTDPTAATASVMPDSGVLGIADGPLAGLIVGRYLVSGGTYANVVRGSGRPQVGVDLSALGVITSARATAVVDGMLTQLRSRRGWTNGLVLAASQITNMGGARSNLAAIQADGFQALRLLGLRDERGLSAATVIGLAETVWDVSDRTITANPIGLVARDLGSIIESAGGDLLTGI